MAATFHSTGETIPITHHSICNSNNLTYMFPCEHCLEQHLGETKRLLKDRFNEYRKPVTSPPSMCLSHIVYHTCLSSTGSLRIHKMTKLPVELMAQLVKHSTGVVERVRFPFKLEFLKTFFRYCPSSVNNCNGLKYHNIWYFFLFYYYYFFISIVLFSNFILQKKSPVSESEIYALVGSPFRCICLLSFLTRPGVKYLISPLNRWARVHHLMWGTYWVFA